MCRCGVGSRSRCLSVLPRVQFDDDKLDIGRFDQRRQPSDCTQAAHAELHFFYLYVYIFSCGYVYLLEIINNRYKDKNCTNGFVFVASQQNRACLEPWMGSGVISRVLRCTRQQLVQISFLLSQPDRIKGVRLFENIRCRRGLMLMSERQSHSLLVDPAVC